MNNSNNHKNSAGDSDNDKIIDNKGNWVKINQTYY